MSAQAFQLPDLGEGLTEATILTWFVAAGDDVAIDQPIVEVETAKSAVEVPSPYAGQIQELHGKAGDTIVVGQPLITIGSPNGTAERYREVERAGSGNVLIGYGTADENTGPRRRRRPRRALQIAGETPSGKAPVVRVISPLVRKIARDEGIDLETLTGTGYRGRITRRDVEAALAVRARSASEAIQAPEPAGAGPAPTSSRTKLPEARRAPMSGFRKAVSASLSASRREIPEATVWVDVDFSELFALRDAEKATGRSAPGLLAYLARFTVAGLHAYPELNGEIDTYREELVQYDGINLGIAVQTDLGLLVPSVIGAHRLTAEELDSEIRRVTAVARDGKTPPVELTAGTFTLNNHGAFRVDGSAAIINHPQVAILGFGRVIDRPWVIGGELTVRKIGQMSFAFDHRVCDGGTAAGFMRAVADAIENPASAIARL